MDGPVARPYDFVVVGGGPAGCVIASRLANTVKKPSVLLLEAGGGSPDDILRVVGKRWTAFMNPDRNWGYMTVPQEHCHNRVINYARGRGLGGSSAINFSAYTVGCRGDYDRWAQIVGDDFFKWERMQPRLKSLETFHREMPTKEHQKYAAPNPSDHGTQGPLHVGYASEWEKDLPPLLDTFEEAGFPRNFDLNSGNPLGMGIAMNSAYQGRMSTAADLLTSHPENLTILTNAPVQRVILKNKRAAGVESNGRHFLAAKDVILSAGSLDTPKILMFSGIGPSSQLERHQLPVIQDFPAVGQGLRDHGFVALSFLRKEHSTDRGAFYGCQEAMDAGMEQWKKDRTGPWTTFACQFGVGYFKSDEITSSHEFKMLPADEKEFLLQDTVPHYELLTHFPAHMFVPNWPKEHMNYNSLVAFVLNGQSRGKVALQSPNPDKPLLFDPKLLSHPYDRRVAIESVRHLLQVVKHPSFTKDNVAELIGPKSESDEDILEFWKENIMSSFHMTGTVKMGKIDDTDAAVDHKFRVFGIGHLRVADMSVVPVLPNSHIQATAYVTGWSCADMLIEEYTLDGE